MAKVYIKLFTDLYSYNKPPDKQHIFKFSVSYAGLRNYVNNTTGYTENGVNFEGFDKPIIVSASYHDIKNYTCMAIGGASNFTQFLYFCYIEKVEYVTSNLTRIYISPNYQHMYKDTLYSDIPGILYWSNLDSDIVPTQPVQGRGYTYEKIKTLSTGENIFFTYHDNSTNEDWIYQMSFPNEASIKSCDIGNYIVSNLHLLLDSVIACQFSPWSVMEGNNNAEVISALDDVPLVTRCKFVDYQVGNIQVATTSDYVHNALESTVITDCVGNIVWESKYPIDSGVTFRTDIYCDLSMTGAIWRGNVTNRFVYNPQHIEYPMDLNFKFSIPCEDYPLFTDSYQLYSIQQRPYTIQLREAQQRYQGALSITNVASSTASGILSGLTFMGPIGALGMGASALAGSGINAIGNTIALENYNNDLNRVENEQSKVSSDLLSFTSENYKTMLSHYYGPAIYRKRIDVLSRDFVNVSILIIFA